MTDAEPAIEPPRPRAGSRGVGGVIVVALLGLQAWCSVRPATLTIANDFGSYLVAARLVRAGRPLDRIYERRLLHDELRAAGLPRLASFIPHPPPNALLLFPLAGLAPPVAKAAWTVVLVAALLASFVAARGVASARPFLVALAFLLPSASIANSLLYGQPYPLLLLCLALSVLCLLRARPFAAGLLVAPVLVLKVYGVAHVLYFLWTRRWRALAGSLAGVFVLAATSVALLGSEVHGVYLREVLPASLAGRALDPYAVSWGSVSTVARRLFEEEPDLNPHPAAELPWLGEALARGLPVMLLLAAVLAGRRVGDDRAARVRVEWAAVTLAALCASPAAATYHFVLLILPVALLLKDGSPRRNVLLLASLAFVTSSATHYFAPLAAGWGNLVAHPRLVVLLALLAFVLRPMLGRPQALAALGAGALAALAAREARGEEGWTRLSEARGYVLAEPIGCGQGLTWLTIEKERFVVRSAHARADGPWDAMVPSIRCVGGRLEEWSEQRAMGAEGRSEGKDTIDPADVDSRADLTVFADRPGAAIRERSVRDASSERVLVRGRVRYPRLSPDGEWVVYQVWDRGSWEVEAVERGSGRVAHVAGGPSNEVEPSWTPDGRRVLFASDRGRGLGLTAVYSVPFPSK